MSHGNPAPFLPGELDARAAAIVHRHRRSPVFRRGKQRARIAPIRTLGHQAPQGALSNDVKLALIGTHGVGKTTLAYDVCALLKKQGHNVELVTEVARRSPFAVNEATTLEGQLWILHAQIAAELEAAHRGPYVLCDRSVLDNYCYLVNKCGRQPELERWLERWLETYDLLVGVPLVRESIYAEGFRQPALNDGFRACDRAFQQRIDALLKELLTEPPFEHFAERVLWLDGIRQSQWAGTVLEALETRRAPKPAAAASPRAVP